MNLQKKINGRIAKYDAKGSLDHTTKLIMIMASIRHASTLEHMQRVALMAEAVARTLKMDPKAAFFGGLLHDIGKIILPDQLFDNHNISGREYAEIKTHAINGFRILQDLHHFTALCAGLHHAMYYRGYGLTANDFPQGWSPATIKKVLDISAIISICDFIDAFTHRNTKIKDGSNDNSPNLATTLKKKYPDDHRVIDVALRHIQ